MPQIETIRGLPFVRLADGSLVLAVSEVSLDVDSGDESVLETPAIVTITNTQIKTIPQTPIELIAAPGVDKLILPLGGLLIVNFAASYVNPGDPIQLALGKPVASNYIGGSNWLTSSNGTFRTPISCPFLSNDLITLQWDLLTSSNKPLVLYDDDNDGGANYTGGDPANWAKIIVYYTIVDVSYPA